MIDYIYFEYTAMIWEINRLILIYFFAALMKSSFWPGHKNWGLQDGFQARESHYENVSAAISKALEWLARGWSSQFKLWSKDI